MIESQMEIKIRDSNAERIKTDLLVIPVREKKLDDALIRALDRRLRGNLRARMQKSKFTGAEGGTLIYQTAGLLPAAQLLLIGLGGGAEIAGDTWRKIGARARREAAALGAEDIAFFFSPYKDSAIAGGALVEGALLAAYQFNKYRSTSKRPTELKSFTLFNSGLRPTAALMRSIEIAQIVVTGVSLARDLVNEPPSVTTAHFLGEQAKKYCRGRGLSAEVWDKRKIESMQLTGLLAVNRGSHEEPRFI